LQADRAEDRHIIEISGDDRLSFLQGLVTNDVKDEGLTYAALLTPQGKYLADFFLFVQNEAVLLDVKSEFAPGLVQRLSMYKLRANVMIAQIEMPVFRGVGAAPDDAMPDPRDPSLGWRYYGKLEAKPTGQNWAALQVAAGVPESGIELTANDSYILEMGFERLNGVDFKKGCYVGQEVTARMKHKTELRKGLARVAVDGLAAPGTEIKANERLVGTLYSCADGIGLAYLRFDRVTDNMTAGDAKVSILD